jgi:hypothetical protein
MSKRRKELTYDWLCSTCERDGFMVVGKDAAALIDRLIDVHAGLSPKCSGAGLCMIVPIDPASARMRALVGGGRAVGASTKDSIDSQQDQVSEKG